MVVAMRARNAESLILFRRIALAIRSGKVMNAFEYNARYESIVRWLSQMAVRFRA